jgi:chromosomal replication initiation ATPase DnaA
MDQLTFRFPFSKKYYEQDYYVSNNNYSAFKLIDGWPDWPGKWLNIHGEKGSGKTHLSKILENKINKAKIISANKINNNTIKDLNRLECLILDNFNKDIDEELLYAIFNHSKQLNNYVLINSQNSIKNLNFNLKDLQSRINSFVFIGIELPTDDILEVIITKTLSDKQISINPKLIDYIINNVERSYQEMFKFIREVDELSLSTGKAININLIKKVLKK